MDPIIMTDALSSIASTVPASSQSAGKVVKTPFAKTKPQPQSDPPTSRLATDQAPELQNTLSQDKDRGTLLLLKDNGSAQSLHETGQASISLDAIVPLDTKGSGDRVTGLSPSETNDGRADSVGNARLDIKA
jgi:hypothetical protein